MSALSTKSYPTSLLTEIGVQSLSASAPAEISGDELFSHWKSHFNKDYSNTASSVPVSTRLDIFLKNADYIVESNKLNRDYTLGLNEFADLTDEEMSRRRGFIPRTTDQ